MFEHADARHLVEALGVVDLAVVAVLDLAPAPQARRLDALVRQLGLTPAQRDAERLDAVMSDRVHDECAPAAADVEEAFARPEPQFATDVVDLARLGRVDGLVGVREVGAGVQQLLVQPQAEELVGQVVVVADCHLVPFEGVLAALELDGQLAGAGTLDRRQAEQVPDDLQEIPRAGLLLDEELGEAEEGEDVALDVEVAVDIRLGEGDAVGRPEHLLERAGVVQRQREVRLLAGLRLDAGAVPESHREVAGAVSRHHEGHHVAAGPYRRVVGELVGGHVVVGRC